MKALPLAAILALALTATAALAQTPAPPPAADAPVILNAKKKPGEAPASPAAEPYAGQKPLPQPPAQAATPATPSAETAPPAASAPATESAAAAAKAAASDAKSASPVPEGPSVKPIAKPAGDSAATQDAKAQAKASSDASTDPKSDPKSAAKSDPVPTVAKPEPKPTLLVTIDLTNQRLSVSENGVAKYKWPISSGRTGYITPKGTFRPVWMSKMWYSRKYDYAPMPHAIFFHGGTAIHGTDSVYALGRPASHGCVRLSPSNAATLYKLVTQHGKQMTRITVFGTPKQAPVASRRDDERRLPPRARRYQDEPWWADDEYDDYPPIPSRRVYSDRYYDRYDRPSRYARPPRSRRYVRDYEPYDFED